MYSFRGVIQLALIICLIPAALNSAAQDVITVGYTPKIKPKLSIVIDDLGDNPYVAEKLLALPVTLTAAVLPHTPYAGEISKRANALGHEVIMHLPMEAFSRPDLLGPGALMADMDAETLVKTLLDSAQSIPGLVGFNNHMGSLLTQDAEKMQWVMQTASQHGWYFLDSRTSESSVAKSSAEAAGIATIGRDIFLDHHNPLRREQLVELIPQRLAKAKIIANRHGQVVVICHPYPETVAYLQQHIEQLSNEFQLVPLSHLLPVNADSRVLPAAVATP